LSRDFEFNIYLFYHSLGRQILESNIFLHFLLQVVRSRLQEQGHHSEKRYSGMIDCIKKVFHQEGVPGFYRGCATNLLRTTPAAVITFTSFEMIHRFLVSHFPSDPQPHIL
jgi:solute carrier family 25 folate transporter 32